MNALEAAWLGCVPYADALERQNVLHARRVAGEIGDQLLHLEHPSVFSIGRRGSRGEVLWSSSELAARGVDVVEADRGGQVTYHGPGQLVGYPIIYLGPGADLVVYLRELEGALISCLAEFGIAGERNPANAGVWVGERKIASIGVKVSRGVTKHGYALNVATDLSYFTGIIACGMPDRTLTSMAELGVDGQVEDVGRVMERCVAQVFGLELVARK